MFVHRQRFVLMLSALMLALMASPAIASAATLGKVGLGINTHYPYQYTNVKVNAKAYSTTGAAMGNVKLTYRFYYKTTTPTVSGLSNASGAHAFSRYISGATPGYKVVVKVTATKNGVTKTATNWFIPKKR